MTGPRQTYLPRYETALKLPSSATIELRDRERGIAAADGSAKLLLALLRYGVKHGLPNMSAEQCSDRLTRLNGGRKDRWKAERGQAA